MLNKKYNLPRIIGLDLLYYGKTPLILLIMVLISSVLILIVTNKTRLLITKYNYLNVKNNQLNLEWHNLILEKNTLINYNKIEKKAISKLNMQYVLPWQEKLCIKSKQGIIVLNEYK